jgi:hypothetical protein
LSGGTTTSFDEGVELELELELDEELEEELLLLLPDEVGVAGAAVSGTIRIICSSGFAPLGKS